MLKKIMLFMLMLHVVGSGILKAEVQEPAKPSFFTNLKLKTQEGFKKCKQGFKDAFLRKELLLGSLAVAQFYCISYCLIDADICFNKLYVENRRVALAAKRNELKRSLLFNACAIPTFAYLGYQCARKSLSKNP